MKTSVKLLAMAAVVALFASCDKDEDDIADEYVEKNESVAFANVNEQLGEGLVQEQKGMYTHNGYGCVDLGLPSGTYWATCNVGGENPEDYGGYYQWGALSTVDNGWLSADNFKTRISADNEYELDTLFDVATQLWGGNWRTPSIVQHMELQRECYWVWTDNYNETNVSGYIVYKSKSAEDKGYKVYFGDTPSASYNIAKDAHIFLPAVGYIWGDEMLNAGIYGYYWSRSCIYNEANVDACDNFFDIYEVGWIYSSCDAKHPVRPVCSFIE